MIQFFKHRTQESFDNLSILSNAYYWATMNVNKTKSDKDGYILYQGQCNASEFNVLPTKSLCLIKIKNKNFSLNISHNFTIQTQASLKFGPFAMIKVSDFDVSSFHTEQYESMQDVIQITKLSDDLKIIIYLHAQKTQLLPSNRDDVTGELYLYSPISCKIYLSEELFN